jgi:hypothetical protein
MAVASNSYTHTTWVMFWGSGLLAAVCPFAQARDTAQQEEEEEHADHNLRKVTFKRRKKGLHSSTKMYFMRS